MRNIDQNSVFGLDPEKMERLLSLGTDDVDGSDSRKDKSTPEDSASSFQDSESPNPTASLDAFTIQSGGTIGRYKLLDALGEGGMGIVFLAEQKRPVRRQVALKVIKPGMDSKRVIARFEAERQALALLDHPNIARVHDGGTTKNGQPYFVMEYVKGLPITDHCDRHKLTIEQRLELFLQVCHAVHHAHQKGIIHRDIKPSNILVSTQDDQVVPKIIDFGIAKAMSQPLTERTVFTEHGQLFGTPEYMSPEQADISTEDIDTRTDIYSLGVLLYVLLTGVLPFESETLRKGGIDHIRQVIRETDPKTPSTRLADLGEEADRIAVSRRTEITTLARRLHRELEWIPLKAMRKDRSERYRSVSELADDIENYLNGTPLIAGPPSGMYRIKKFVRRNGRLVVSIAVVLAVLIAGSVVSTVFAIRAKRNAAFALDVSKIIFKNMSPLRPRRDKGTIKSILDTTASDLEGRFEGEPIIEGEIRFWLGYSYANLAEFETAKPHLQRALQIAREQQGEYSNPTLASLRALGQVLRRQGRHAEAEQYHIDALRVATTTFGPEHYKTLGAMHNLGLLYMKQGRYVDWEQLSLKELSIFRRVMDPNHEEAALHLSNAGRMHAFRGRYTEAEKLLKETDELCRRQKPKEHAYITEFSGWLGWLYHLQGRYDEALPLLKGSVEMCHLTRVDGDDVLLRFMNFLGALYTDLKEYAEAENLFKEAMDKGGRKLGEDHPYVLAAVHGLGVLYREQGQYDGARSLLDKALEGRRDKLGDDHPDTLESKNDFGVLHKEQGNYEDAQQLLLEAVNGRTAKLGPRHPHTLTSIKNMIDLYEAWGKSNEADELRPALIATEGPEK